jgi:hypothetical protein
VTELRGRFLEHDRGTQHVGVEGGEAVEILGQDRHVIDAGGELHGHFRSS